jgi:hypothetical protein
MAWLQESSTVRLNGHIEKIDADPSALLSRFSQELVRIVRTQQCNYIELKLLQRQAVRVVLRNRSSFEDAIAYQALICDKDCFDVHLPRILMSHFQGNRTAVKMQEDVTSVRRIIHSRIDRRGGGNLG